MESEYKHVKSSKKGFWIHFFRQGLVAMILWTSYIITGLSKGTPTVAIPQLRKDANSTAAVSIEMASWLTSSSGYSGAISIVIVIPIGHFMGRKFIMVILSANALIVSTIIYFSRNTVHLLISQIILGTTAAAESSIFLLILTEYSSPKYRGVFLTLKSATLFWGIWIANAIGIFTHYQYIGLVGIVCSINSLIICLFIPESPYWLANKGRYDECTVSHRWLKGINKDAEEELDSLIIYSQKNITRNINNYSLCSVRKRFKIYVLAMQQPDISKPILLCCLVVSIYIFSGKMVCSVYSIEIMKKITNDLSSVHIGVLILDGFTVFGMYVGCALSKILKRRTLLLTTSTISAIFLFAMCIYLYLNKFSLLSENYYIIVAMLTAYSTAVCCGPIILSTSISAELLPMKFRSFCVSIFSLFTLFMSSTVIKVSPFAFNLVGVQGIYLGFGICSAVLITLFYKYVPETKDLTLYEIANIFKPNEMNEINGKLLGRT